MAPRIPITARTRIVGLIGDPVAHSRSPAMHNAAFRALALPWAYVAFRVDAARVGEAVAAVRALGLAGLNVTIPHKEAVVPHLDRLSRRAQACRAVNTIVNRRGMLLGENTDVIGLERHWSELGVPRRLAAAVVIGAGGSARAVVIALAARAARIVVAARRPERARALARELRPRVRAGLEALDLAELAPGGDLAGEHLANAELVVNTTPVGMSGGAFVPLAYAETSDACLFYDLIYTSERTPFMSAARRARRRAEGGLGLLLHQGAAAFELWTGVAPPLDVMRRALRSPPESR